MSVIACPSCQGKTPSGSVACVHCGALAPVCWVCGGTGKCSRCQGAYPDVAGCDHCGQSGKCSGCDGRKRAWSATAKKKTGG